MSHKSESFALAHRREGASVEASRIATGWQDDYIHPHQTLLIKTAERERDIIMKTACIFLAASLVARSCLALSTIQTPTRRAFLSTTSAITVGLVVGSNAIVAPTMANAATTTAEVITTESGIKYATLKPATAKGRPRDKDIVAIEYTGYLTDGSIFGECV
jgi:predicted anti-sigma-YlaC factor YlaD